MSERETLALQGLTAGNTVSWNLATSTDTYERPGRTVAVTFDPNTNVAKIVSSDGEWFASTLDGAMRAIGAIQ